MMPKYLDFQGDWGMYKIQVISNYMAMHYGVSSPISVYLQEENYTIICSDFASMRNYAHQTDNSGFEVLTMYGAAGTIYVQPTTEQDHIILHDGQKIYITNKIDEYKDDFQDLLK